MFWLYRVTMEDGKLVSIKTRSQSMQIPVIQFALLFDPFAEITETHKDKPVCVNLSFYQILPTEAHTSQEALKNI